MSGKRKNSSWIKRNSRDECVKRDFVITEVECQFLKFD